VGLGSGAIDYDEEEDDSDQAEEAVSKATAARSVAELQTEVEELNRLVAHARRAMSGGPERKVEELERVIREQTVSDRAEKILISRNTATRSNTSLQLRGWGKTCLRDPRRVERQDRSRREAVSSDRSVLVATEAAGEGSPPILPRDINWISLEPTVGATDGPAFIAMGSRSRCKSSTSSQEHAGGRSSSASWRSSPECAMPSATTRFTT